MDDHKHHVNYGHSVIGDCHGLISRIFRHTPEKSFDSSTLQNALEIIKICKSSFLTSSSHFTFFKSISSCMWRRTENCGQASWKLTTYCTLQLGWQGMHYIYVPWNHLSNNIKSRKGKLKFWNHLNSKIFLILLYGWHPLPNIKCSLA